MITIYKKNTINYTVGSIYDNYTIGSIRIDREQKKGLEVGRVECAGEVLKWDVSSARVRS